MSIRHTALLAGILTVVSAPFACSRKQKCSTNHVFVYKGSEASPEDVYFINRDKVDTSASQKTICNISIDTSRKK